MDDDHEIIYLQPQCLADQECRLWCQDDVWDGECLCGEGCKSTKYFRADFGVRQ